MSRADNQAHHHVTVIGAGILGVAIAYGLRREGIAVTLIDRQAPGMGCSYGNAGAVSPGSVAPIAMPGVLAQVPGYLLDPHGPVHIRWRYLPQVAPWLMRFAWAARPAKVDAISKALAALQAPALDRYETVLREVGAADLLSRSGQLHLYPDARAMAKDASVWALRRARGVEVVEVGRAEVVELEPEVGPDYSRGVFLPNEGMVRNPHRVVTTIAEAFTRAGGELVRAEVRDLDIGADGPTHLITDAGRRRVQRLVIAAGAHSHLLVRRLGHRVPLQTQRGYHLMLAAPGVHPLRPVVAADAKCFATPMEGGLRLAGTVELTSLHAPPDYARARALLVHGQRLFPRLHHEGTSEWMGDRPCLPDSLPVIARLTGAPAVVAAFGHGHLGLTGAVVTADLVADILVGRKPRIDITPFDIRRFA